MRTLIHGNDRGYAVIFALVLITIFSTLFAAFASYIQALKKNSALNKVNVINSIEQSNREIINSYDLR